MNTIQIVCCLVAFCLAVLLDMLCHSYGYTILCLFGIAVLGVVLSYDYRKQCEEAEKRKAQYQRRLHSK